MGIADDFKRIVLDQQCGERSEIRKVGIIVGRTDVGNQCIVRDPAECEITDRTRPAEIPHLINNKPARTTALTADSIVADLHR